MSDRVRGTKHRIPLTANLVTAVRTIATLMSPSPPGMTSWMHPSCHLKGGTLSSFSKLVPTWIDMLC